MIIVANGNTYDLKVASYSPSWDSGIEWRQVGNKFKAIDNGESTSHWETDITIRDIGGSVSDLRADIIADANSGKAISITCNIWEPIFGPEISYTSAISCLVDADDEPYSTGNLNESILTEWTFTLHPNENLYARYLNYTGSMPSSGLRMLSATRLDNGARILTQNIERAKATGFGFNAPTVEIQYEGSLSAVAQAIAYLQKRRENAFTYSASMVWPFTKGTLSESVYVLDIEYDGQEDKAGLLHRFTVMYAKV